MQSNRKTTATKRALLLGAPFLFISIALVLVISIVMTNVIEQGTYYAVATNAPKMTNKMSTADNYPNLTDDQKDAIKATNKGLPYEDFPIITLGSVFAYVTVQKADGTIICDYQPVYHGDYEDLLMLGIGHYENSRFPGQHGKVVMAGHVGIQRFFQRLENCTAGDYLIMDCRPTYGDDEKYVYKYIITDTYIFDLNIQEEKNELNNHLILPDKEDTGDRVIAYTCYPYRSAGVRHCRFVVDCKLVYGWDWLTEEMIDEEVQVSANS